MVGGGYAAGHRFLGARFIPVPNVDYLSPYAPNSVMGMTYTPLGIFHMYEALPTCTAKNEGSAFRAAGLRAILSFNRSRLFSAAATFSSLSLTSNAPPPAVGQLDDDIDFQTVRVAVATSWTFPFSRRSHPFFEEISSCFRAVFAPIFEDVEHDKNRCALARLARLA